jgi:hypothetical protein
LIEIGNDHRLADPEPLAAVKRQLFFPVATIRIPDFRFTAGRSQRQLLFPFAVRIGIARRIRRRLSSPRRVKRRRALRGRNPTKG